MRRVVPLIVGDFKCARARERDAYVGHWDEEFEALETIRQRREPKGSWGGADRAEWLAIQDFQHHTADLLAWVADTLMPRGTALHSEGIDAAIGLLRERMAGV